VALQDRLEPVITELAALVGLETPGTEELEGLLAEDLAATAPNGLHTLVAEEALEGLLEELALAMQDITELAAVEAAMDHREAH
jgi:hypothetical protein